MLLCVCECMHVCPSVCVSVCVHLCKYYEFFTSEPSERRKVVI